MNPIFILASTSILSLQCVGDNVIFDFKIDLATRSGEMVYHYRDEPSLYLSDRLTVTPNYIRFPLEDAAVILDRKNSTATLGMLGGVCEVVDVGESKTVF